MIDNSSRLRSGSSSINEVNARLPVTLKYTTPYSGYPIHNPNNLNPPGPAFIYPGAALNLVQVPAKPASQYMHATKPPVQSNPSNTYLPPPTTKTPAKPLNLYIPVSKPEIHSNPANVYVLAQKLEPPASINLSSKSPATINLPLHSAKPPSAISNDILPPKQSESECESLQGKLVIPIPLKSRDGDDYCGQIAKLVLPIKSLDSYSINKLKATTPDEIDATQLIRNILENLL